MTTKLEENDTTINSKEYEPSRMNSSTTLLDITFRSTTINFNDMNVREKYLTSTTQPTVKSTAQYTTTPSINQITNYKFPNANKTSETQVSEKYTTGKLDRDETPQINSSAIIDSSTIPSSSISNKRNGTETISNAPFLAACTSKRWNEVNFKSNQPCALIESPSISCLSCLLKTDFKYFVDYPNPSVDGEKCMWRFKATGDNCSGMKLAFKDVDVRRLGNDTSSCGNNYIKGDLGTF